MTTPNPITLEQIQADKATIRPMCMTCGDKRAKRLPLHGNYGKCSFFCSLRCAAIQGLEHPMSTDMVWCETHKTWSEAICPFCEPE
jgi:hypothetical protein